MIEGEIDLGEIGDEPFECSMEKFITARTAVIGMSGSGKSHLIGVIAEELSENGASFVIIDPEGEYNSLKERYEVVWAGKDPEADVELNLSSVKKLAGAVIRQDARMILDTSDSKDIQEEFEVISGFLDRFYELETRSKRPILLIVEEADRFSPQFGGERMKKLLEISRRGRKRGIGLLIATQRPQMVDKNILSQCGNQLIGKLRNNNDLKAVDLFFSSKKRVKELPNLRLGEFYAMGEFNPASGLLKVKERTTSSLGSTPRGRTGRKRKFSVDDFMSGVDLEGPVRIRESKEIAGDKKSSRKASNKKKKGSSIKGVPFRIKKKKALSIAREEADRTLFTGKSKESIGSIDKLYWPLYICSITETRRSFFRMKKTDHKAVLDPVLLRFLRFKESYSFKEVFPMDIRFLDIWNSSRTDIWQDIRILRELQKEDMTSNDIAAAIGAGLDPVRSSMRSLKRKKLVSTVGKAGSASIYRPLVSIKDQGIKDVGSEFPEPKEIEPGAKERTVEANIDRKQAGDLVKGLFERCELVHCDTIYLPFYLASLHHKKKGTTKRILIHGVTGEETELAHERFLRTGPK